ncbi:MAG TPA: hypothetical protein VHY84_19305, partial [Bryobacteraceae bacterium]|nr:hypothetical protein [Bryobacteraceae bacterium]
MSSTRITRLTPGQEKRLAEVYNEWLAVGRNCGPLDRAAVTATVEEFYGRIGKAAPVVMFFSSPLMCVLAWSALRMLSAPTSQLDSQLASQLASQLRSQLRSQLYSQLDSQLYSQLRSQLYSQLDSQLHSQ